MAFKFGKLTALVIGNHDYPGNNADLQGVKVDIQNWRRILPLLANHQKYVDHEITFLENQTGSQMRTAIASLLDPNPKPKSSFVVIDGAESEIGGARDTRLLVYSGHGGGVKDTSGDEPTGIDAALIGTDAQIAAPDPNVGYLLQPGGCVVDDYVSSRANSVHQLAALYFVYDCCYSGGSARAFGQPVPWYTRGMGKPVARQNFGPDHGRGPTSSQPGRGLWLEAAAWNETAKEPMWGGGGFFTQALMVALANLDVTPSVMHSSAVTALAPLARAGDPQTPQIEDAEGLAGKPFLHGHWVV